MSHIIIAPLKNVKIPYESAGKLLHDRLNSFPENSIALVENSNVTWTYREIITKSEILAKNLREQLKITKNNIIAIVSGNTGKFWVATLAALYLAAPVHLINPRYTTYELKRYFELSKPKLIFCTLEALDNVLSIKKECHFIENIILFDDGDVNVSRGTNRFVDLLKSHCTTFEFETIEDLENQVAFICHSSGTTGLPKGAMITHANIWLNLCHSNDDDLYPRTPNPIVNVVPVYHVHGFSLSYTSLYQRVKIVIMDNFQPRVYLENVQNHGVRNLFIVPSLGDFLANSPLVDQYDLSSVKEIYLAAGVLRKNTEEKILQKFNIATIRTIYGLTELAAAIFTMPVNGGKPGSCGKLTPGHQVKIVDTQTGNALGCNQTGEICVKGFAMKGYINDPEKSGEAFDPDGFVRTGDIGYYDQDLYFYIVDRMKDLIKYKSFQVPPLEVEQVLLMFPGVTDAAVVGKPDERYGELPVAFVVKGADLEERELMEHVGKFLAKEKHLHGGVRFVEEIPRNEIGKILRKKLREMLE
ncbi:4-coumarate--CoA ligase 1-like [Tribolium madens]|uniref:4-coumarate--CoA ligase 1-like n=1 Tax=Tribolium madens TaxID=41895 RepID=UPI001CF766F5|nr:4-coumarate--CoA ligase 1-like [Tribolium madens]